MSKIKRNAIQCKYCGIVIESKHRHDFVVHECTRAGKISTEFNHDKCKYQPSFPRIAVDGGKEYLRRLGNPIDMIELSEYSDE